METDPSPHPHSEWVSLCWLAVSSFLALDCKKWCKNNSNRFRESPKECSPDLSKRTIQCRNISTILSLNLAPFFMPQPCKDSSPVSDDDQTDPLIASLVLLACGRGRRRRRTSCKNSLFLRESWSAHYIDMKWMKKWNYLLPRLVFAYEGDAVRMTLYFNKTFLYA